MYAVFAPTAFTQPLTASAMNSGPLSERDVGRNTSQDEQARKSVDDLSRVQLPFHPDSQTFSTVFIQDVQCSERPAIIGSVMHKIIRPNMIAILRAQPHTWTIIQPKPFDAFVIQKPWTDYAQGQCRPADVRGSEVSSVIKNVRW